MQAVRDICYPCLRKLIYKNIEMAKIDSVFTDTSTLESRIDNQLNEIFSQEPLNVVPTKVAGELQRIVRDEINCPDPFKNIKIDEMKLAKELSEEFYPEDEENFEELISFAVKGNSIDFFVPIDRLYEEISKKVDFAINEIPWLISYLERMSTGNRESKILYLADNAGECYFDLPLFRKLRDYGKVFYTVKESPVQNDLTLDDLKVSGLEEEFQNIISSGTDTPGLDIDIANKSFLSHFHSADLIVAKGMGHYETFTEIEADVPVFLLMKAKCEPIALSLGVAFNSYVAVKL